VQATNNGLPVTFTIVAADSSLAASGLFSITLSDGRPTHSRSPELRNQASKFADRLRTGVRQ